MKVLDIAEQSMKFSKEVCFGSSCVDVLSHVVFMKLVHLDKLMDCLYTPVFPRISSDRTWFILGI